MKALVLDIKREDWERTTGLTLTRMSEPRLSESKHPEDADKVIVKPRFTGFCGSDKGIWFRHAFKDMIFDSLEANGQPYRICGHELLGEIVDAGSTASKAYGCQPGDMVSAESHIFCGHCHQCRIGDAHVCANHLIIGISTDGCFAEYVKLPARELWKTDTERIRPEVAAIQEPLGNAVHACSRVDLRGRTVAVFGCGTIGLLTILVARAMGAAFIVGVDPNTANLELAQKLDVDLALRVAAPENARCLPDREIVERIKQNCFGEGVDLALEMSGSNQALNTAIAATRAGGDVILFGISAGDYTITDFQQIIMYGKTLHSVVGRKVFQTWYTLSNLLQSRGHNLQDKIYEVILNRGRGTIFPFRKFEKETFEQALRKHPKIILQY
ncbi:MAG: zinc-binding dehydrogenase [Nitrospinales bacterium]